MTSDRSLFVRNDHEHLAISLGGVNIPLKELSLHLPQMVLAIATVVYCKSGARSLKALHAINAKASVGRCRILSGGLDAYIAAGCLERLNTSSGML